MIRGLVEQRSEKLMLIESLSNPFFGVRLPFALARFDEKKAGDLNLNGL
jgi:hypothetical protein